MYQNYFGLKEQAFSIAVNPRYLYMSQQHKEALAHLLYGVKEGGFVMLTGEVGTGKTTIIRCLLEQLPATTEIAIILNPMADIKELLCTICDEFGIQTPPDKLGIKALTDRLHQHLLSNHKRGKNTVLLIDEAQLLSAEVLEQIRLLTNLETSTKKLLQIVLVGQPELNALLAQPRLRQLSQRITARFHLTPLTQAETQGYINHRLSVAGMPEDRNPFSPRIVKQIHRFTGGIPRMINVLCERTLIGAYGHNQSLVDNKIFQLAKKEVAGYQQGEPATARAQQPYFIYGLLAASAIIGLGSIFLLLQVLLASQRQPLVPIAELPPSPAQPITPPAQAQTLPDQRAFNVALMEAPLGDPVSAFDIDDPIKAQSLLFEYLDFAVDPNTHPCWQINNQGYHCQQATLDTWEQIASLNRPMVLSLINSHKFKSNAVLIGLQDKYALLIDARNTRTVVELDALGPLWTGDVFYTWKKPRNYHEPLSMGDSNDTVAAVAAQFAMLDSQTRPLATRRFNRALRERVKIFQREHDLVADGILGERTLMKLNETLGLSTTLEREFL